MALLLLLLRLEAVPIECQANRHMPSMEERFSVFGESCEIFTNLFPRV